MSAIHFNATLYRPDATLYRPDATVKIGLWVLLTLPKDASAQLPTRGMTIVEGTINGFHFRAPLEPDGQGSHWFGINKTMCEAVGIDVGDTVILEIEPARVWPEPELPTELKEAFAADPKAHALWRDITTMARWDWIRWMDSVKQLETRRERPEKLCSMLKAGKRRPCCFNRTLRTLPKCAEAL